MKQQGVKISLRFRTTTDNRFDGLLEGLSIDQPRAILPEKKRFFKLGLTQKKNVFEPYFLMRFLVSILLKISSIQR